MAFRVGLTGGIGSGKTTVTNLFSKLGIEIIDADAIAHQITQKNQVATQKIIAHFGADITHPDGSLNRKRLREIVFQNPTQRKWLEKTLHPIIIEEIKTQSAKVTSPYCIIVIPLLVETNTQHLLDRICVIDISEATQIERAHRRDQTSKKNIEAIMKSQSQRQQRLTIANDVIQNDQDLAFLQQQVNELHQQYLSLAKQQQQK